jgi:hypothetical protein
MSEKIGPLDKDTALVLAITGVSSAVIILLSAVIMLANSWTAMAEPDRASDEYVPSHGGHGDDHGGGHGDEHAAEASGHGGGH